jgi:hypothetical protein
MYVSLLAMLFFTLSGCVNMAVSKFQNFINRYFRKQWWIKVQTETPTCTYYFGPFSQKDEAKNSQVGYLDDLVKEGAREITVDIEKSCPQQLTIYRHE